MVFFDCHICVSLLSLSYSLPLLPFPSASHTLHLPSSLPRSTASLIQCHLYYTTIIQVKLDLPSTLVGRGTPVGEATPSECTERDIRFSGSFVMYNYARIATILSHFKRACEKGTCVYEVYSREDYYDCGSLI